MQQEQWMHGCHSLSQALFLGQFVPVNSGQTSNPLGEEKYSTYTLSSLLHSSQIATGTLALWHGGGHVAPMGQNAETLSLAPPSSG